MRKDFLAQLKAGVFEVDDGLNVGLEEIRQWLLESAIWIR